MRKQRCKSASTAHITMKSSIIGCRLLNRGDIFQDFAYSVLCFLTESPAPSGGLLDHNASADNVSELGEEAEQGLVGHRVRDVKNKKVASIGPCNTTVNYSDAINRKREEGVYGSTQSNERSPFNKNIFSPTNVSRIRTLYCSCTGAFSQLLS